MTIESNEHTHKIENKLNVKLTLLLEAVPKPPPDLTYHISTALSLPTCA